MTFHSGNLQRVHLSSGVRQCQRLIVVDGLSLIDSAGFAPEKLQLRAITESYSAFTVLPVLDCS